jgi:hypothetical protein
MPDRFACPCCGYLTLHEEPTDTYEICHVCGWEDDGLQFDDPDYRGGANQESLNECRADFHAWADAGFPPDSRRRPPTPAELPQK